MNRSPVSHETLHHEMVERIVADLRPVRRLWPTSLRLALWVALEMAVLLLIVVHTGRANLMLRLADPWYLIGFGGFAATGVIGAAFALRSAVPGDEPRPIGLGLLLSVAAASALLLVHQPFNGAVPLRNFIDQGMPCAVGILMLAAIPWLALTVAVWRGAPLSAGRDGALVGAAAFLSSFALMRVRCPIDEGMHLFVWHFLPALAGIALSASVGLWLFKRRISHQG